MSSKDGNAEADASVAARTLSRSDTLEKAQHEVAQAARVFQRSFSAVGDAISSTALLEGFGELRRSESGEVSASESAPSGRDPRL